MSQLASAAPFPSPATARIRLSRRRIVSVLAFVLCLTAGLIYVNGLGKPATYSVLLVTHQVARGGVITADDIQPRTVALPEELGSSAISAEAIGQVVGQRAVETLHLGAPVLNGQLAAPGDQVPGMARIAFPIVSEHAAGGHIVVGDAVRILITSDRGKATAKTSMAADGVSVSGVGYADSGFTSGQVQAPSSKLAWLEVLVPVESSAAFVQALSTGDADVVILPPAGR